MMAAVFALAVYHIARRTKIFTNFAIESLFTKIKSANDRLSIEKMVKFAQITKLKSANAIFILIHENFGLQNFLTLRYYLNTCKCTCEVHA